MSCENAIDSSNSLHENDMAQNIEDFNTGVALILGELYEKFPEEIQLRPNEFPTINWQRGPKITHAEIDRHNELYRIYYHTARFLLAEGFIRGNRVEGYTFINDCTLTTKGLSALQKVPKSIKGKNRMLGDFLVELGKDGLKNAAKESISLTVKAILSS